MVVAVVGFAKLAGDTELGVGGGDEYGEVEGSTAFMETWVGPC